MFSLISRIRHRHALVARRFMLEQLEERIVLNAAPAGTAEQNPEQASEPIPCDGQAGSPPDPAQAAEAATTACADQPADPISEIYHADLSVVLISNALDDIQAISDAASDDATVIVYDAETDDLATITVMLEDLVDSHGGKIGTLAVVAHADPGILSIGSDYIDFFNVKDYGPVFEALAANLTEDAQIHLYGCYLAGNVLGQALVDRISIGTGADVFASTDTTAGQWHDWDLEYSSDSDVVMNPILDSDKLAEVEAPLGAHMVKDINPFGSSNPNGLTACNGGVMFKADDGSGTGLFWSDGTWEGTVRLTPDTNPVQWWAELENVDGILFFYACDELTGYELWMSDGTDTGTHMVKNIGTDELSSFLPPDDMSGHLMCSVDGTLFFAASTSLGPDSNPWGGADSTDWHWELWMSDGTASGTVQVMGANPLVDGIPGWSEFYEVNGTLFFTATDGVNGYELWKCEYGSVGGIWTTSMVKDINGSGNGIVEQGGSGYGSKFEVVGDLLIFTADEGDGDELQLWRTDGTESGTFRLGTFESAPSYLTAIGDTIFFQADGYWDIDGDSIPDSVGTELWKTDGSPTGAVLVKDIAAGADSGVPARLTNVGGTLFFSAFDGEHGSELWKSDGTEAGTVLVKDIRPGPESGLPLESWVEFIEVTDTLAFWADDGENGRRLWQSDGTEAGTKMAEGEIDYANYGYCWVHVNPLYYSYNDGTNGTELWVWVPDAVIPAVLPVQEPDPMSIVVGFEGEIFTTSPVGLDSMESEGRHSPGEEGFSGPSGEREPIKGIPVFDIANVITDLEEGGNLTWSLDDYCGLDGYATAVKAGKVLVFNMHSLTMFDQLSERAQQFPQETKVRDLETPQEPLWGAVSRCLDKCHKTVDMENLWAEFKGASARLFGRPFGRPHAR